MTRQQILDATRAHLDRSRKLMEDVDELLKYGDAMPEEMITAVEVSIRGASAHAEIARALCAFHETMFGSR